ncbi:MAG: hypothetical protein WDM89_02085 [Rhizomicrobium sp.]
MPVTLTKNPGLLWGLAVKDGKAAHVTDDTAADVFAQPHDWAWMHFALSDHRGRRFLETLDAAPEGRAQIAALGRDAAADPSRHDMRLWRNPRHRTGFRRPVDGDGAAVLLAGCGRISSPRGIIRCA